MTQEERLFSKELFDKCEDLRVRLKRWNEYLDFCEINELAFEADLSIFDYVAQLVASGLKLRTVQNYKSHVMAARARGVSPLAALSKRLSKGVSKSPRRHALDISLERLRQAVSLLREINPRVAAIAVAMALIGMRFSDLWFLERTFMRLKKSTFSLAGEAHQGLSISVDVRRAKNIMKDVLRRRLVIPACWLVEVEDLLGPLKDWYESAQPTDTLAIGTVTEFNSYLAHIDMSDYAGTEHSERFYTSYSLRRFAFANFIDHCTDELGVVDWSAASRFSLHMKDNTLQAFYQGGLEDEKEE